MQHLFSVAAGLDSMVVGESQILGQLRAAYAAARRAGAVDRVLHELASTRCGPASGCTRRPGIDRAGASVVSVGLSEAERVSARWPASGRGRRRRSMGALSAATLARAGVGERRRRQPVPASGPSGWPRIGGPARAVPWTGAGRAGRCRPGRRLHRRVGTVLARHGRGGAAGRAGRPLVLLDLALPRDFDGAAGVLPRRALPRPGRAAGAGDPARRARGRRAGPADHRREVAGRLGARRATAVAPTVTALRARAAEVVDAELARLDARLPGLDASARAEVARTCTGLCRRCCTPRPYGSRSWPSVPAATPTPTRCANCSTSTRPHRRGRRAYAARGSGDDERGLGASGE